MTPRIRSRPEDFDVEEIPLYPLAGKGDHLYVQIEKRLRTTDEVLSSLARSVGLKPREVGYAGRKDRLAVTRQWFSLPTAGSLAGWELEGARVLATDRHPEKLRVGQLRGNRFRLTVRDVGEEAARRAAERWSRIARRGLPNRFGRQRFGRDGKNAARGAELLRGMAWRGNRRTAWLMVSAFQSAVFNRVLELRPWPIWELVSGDLAYAHATGELVSGEALPDPGALETFELSPTGPIFGTKMRWPLGQVAELERRVLEEFGVDPSQRLKEPRGIRLFGTRRALRVEPRGASMERLGDVLRLELELPAGSYATVLLEELLPQGFEEGPPQS